MGKGNGDFDAECVIFRFALFPTPEDGTMEVKLQ